MQQLLQGEGSLKEAVKLISQKGFNNLFIITGKHFSRQNDLNILDNLQYIHFIKEGTNVTDTEVKLVGQAYKSSNAQVVLAIGGGSVIDLAKMIVWECVQQSIPVPLLAAVPTTTGSGSEATQFAVVYESNKKKSISHPALLPAIVSLDPTLIYSLSPHQSAISGMDALAQAVESYWSKAATLVSKQFSATVISLWNNHFISSLGNNKEAKTAMQMAAYNAGKAINITRTTGPHALSYYLTAEYNIPHGQAVALFLPLFFLYNQPSADLSNLLGANSNNEAAELIQNRMKESGLAISLAELDIDKEKIVDNLLGEVNEERFDNNPMPFKYDVLKKLILDNL
jgi:alcohol dehydrogenase class IV